MAITFGAVSVSKPGRPPSVVRTTRKVAIFGSNTKTLTDAPWEDSSWEKWGHASSRAWYKCEMDRYFDLHPKSCWSRGGRKTAQYPKWLAKNTVPIYMQAQHPEVPASIEYPKRRILAEYGEPRPYFTNQVAWMIALALTEGVTTIGLWGIEYGIESEYVIQRSSCEYWIGRAAERGVRIILPEQCTLLAEPVGLYGYESHDLVTGKRLPEYERKEWKPEPIPIRPGVEPGKLAEPPEHLKEAIEQELIDYPRPDGWIGPLPFGGNGHAKEA